MFIGDFCILPSTEITGICKPISSCPSAIASLQTQGIFPKNCGFRANEPIVCCAPETEDNAPSTANQVKTN